MTRENTVENFGGENPHIYRSTQSSGQPEDRFLVPKGLSRAGQ